MLLSLEGSLLNGRGTFVSYKRWTEVDGCEDSRGDRNITLGYGMGGWRLG